MPSKRRQKPQFPWQIQHWPMWILVGLLWFVVLCLNELQARKVGQKLAGLLVRVPPLKRRENVVRVNLSLALPDFSETERDELIRKNIRETGAFFFEVIYLCLRSSDFLSERSEVRGLEVLQKAQAKGKNVLLLSYHTTCNEPAGVSFSNQADIDIVFRRQRNKVMDYLLYRHREPHFHSMINRDDTDAILRACRDTKKQRIVWLIPDQDFGATRSVFVPFLGYEEAATLTAPSRLAESYDMETIVLHNFFDEDLQKWVIELKDIEDYPSGDVEEDARKMNEAFAEGIRQHPEQYYWVHRRFKTFPDGGKRDYKAPVMFYAN